MYNEFIKQNEGYSNLIIANKDLNLQNNILKDENEEISNIQKSL